MKKFILSFLFVALGLSFLSAQECTLRLEMPETMPAIGEEFFVEVWMDVLDYPGYTLNGGDPTLKSGQMGVTFDEAVITPIKTGGPVPLQKYAWNINAMFADYDAKPAEGYPNPGDLRFVSYTVLGPGMDPVFYGGLPLHMWDLKFMYNGGDIEISWQDTDKTTKVAPNVSGGTKEKIVTFWTAWDNVEYAMTYVNYPLPISAITWNGSVSTDWFDGANWDGGVVPTFADDVVVGAGMPNDPVIETNDAAPAIAEVANLTNDAGITVNPLGYFSVYGTFTNNGSLLVLSDATYNGSFIYSGDLGGTFQYDRYMGADGTGVEGGWHYMSTPVAGFGSYYMYDYYINTWDEATSMWIQHPGDPQIPCTPAPEIFNDGMEGWSVNFDEAYLCEATLPGTGMTVEFMGAPNWGDQTGAATNTGVGLYAGFNLVGNPYPSYWDYDAYFFGPNWGNLLDAIYYWDEDMMQYASYVNGIGTNGGNNFVPPAQAFFLEASADDVLTFTDAERTHVYNVPFWKDATDMVKLMATANGYTDETVIRFGEEFTTARDNSDARKLISTASSVPTLYTMASNLTISVNGMPATENVALYFECGTSGSYTIETVETSDFSYLVLEDLLTGSQTNLLEGSYTFEHATGNQANRFVVHFAPLSIDELGANSVKIWARDNNIIVNVPAEVTGDVVVYNMMGQEVTRTDIVSVETQIPVSDVNTYYVVKVISDSNAVTGKVYIK